MRLSSFFYVPGLSVAFLLVGVGGSAHAEQLKLGAAHPPVVLPAVDGGAPVSIDAYRGQKVLLISISPLVPESYTALTDWYKAVEPYRKSNKLVVLGLMQEQHRDRAALFAQWRRPPVPVLFDPLNLGCAYRLPAVVALDETGMIRAVNPKLSKFESFEKRFLKKKKRKSKEGGRPPQLEPAEPKVLKRQAEESRILSIERDYADANFLTGVPAQLDEAMRAYSKVLQADPSDALAYFRLGVAFRTRAESSSAAPDDAARAIECWRNALKLQPKNVVFKTRLAEFDSNADAAAGALHWIEEAREAIKKRGETPLAIASDPRLDRRNRSVDDGTSTGD